MKKTLRILTMLAVGLFFLQSCNDDENETVTEVKKEFNIDGTWVVKEGDEEVKYAENSGRRFYTTFTDIIMSGSLEGFYYLGGDATTGYKVTRNYTFRNMSVVEDFTITKYTDNSFSTSSKTSKADYYRIRDVIELEPGGESIMGVISGDITILDTTMVYVKDNRIISTGKKGKTYIKVNEADPYMIKVMVGTTSNFYDLWYDYARYLGKNIQVIREELGNPDEWGRGSDGTEQCVYWGMNGTHSQINQVNLLFDNEDKVEQIVFFIKSSATQSQIRSYLKEKYFENIIDGSNFYYTSLPLNDENKKSPLLYVVVYNPSANIITFLFYPKEQNQLSLWDNPNLYFGMTVNQAKESFNAYELTHEVEGALQYNVTDSASNISIISPRFYGPNNTMSSFLLQYKSTLTTQEVDDFIRQDAYLFRTEIRPNGNSYECYQSNDRSYGVTHNLSTRVVTYYDMYWDDFTKSFGKTKEELIPLYGTPRDMNEYITFSPSSDSFVEKILLTLDDQKRVDSGTITLKSETDPIVVTNYLSLLYHYFGVDEDGYRYYDSPYAVSAQSIILYNPDRCRIYYIPVQQ